MDSAPAKPWYKTKTGMVFVGVLSMAIAAVVLFLSMVAYYSWNIKYGDAKKLAEMFSPQFSLASNATATSRTLTNEDIQKAIYKESPTIGAKNAPVKILAFIDFECPFCQKSYSTFKGVVDTYAPVAQIVFKHYPIQSLHPNSENAALAAACADSQGKFWPYYDALFTQKKLDDDGLRAAAAALKMNMTKWDACYQDRQLDSVVQRDMQDGANFGVRGTPTYFVNGKKIEGAVDREVWDAVLREELKKN